MGPRDPLERIANGVGAVVGAVGLVYIVGAVALSLRYDGFGMPGNQAAAVTPREVLLAAGLRTLVVWAAIGTVIALILSARDGRIACAITDALRSPRVRAAVVVLAVGLLFVRVLWPLAVLVGILAMSYAIVRWDVTSLKRTLVIALAVAVVTVAYEADRLTYSVESTCLELTEPTGRACGILVGQQDRGFHLAASDRPGVDQLALVFVPARRVERAVSRERLIGVIDDVARQRRTIVIRRIVGIDPR